MIVPIPLILYIPVSDDTSLPNSIFWPFNGTEKRKHHNRSLASARHYAYDVIEMCAPLRRQRAATYEVTDPEPEPEP